MKKTITTYGFRKCIQTLLVLNAIINVQNVYAAPDTLTLVKPEMVNQSSVIVAGTTETEILVDVKVFNTNAEKLSLIIEDELGDELYKKEIDSTDFTKRFRLQKADNISNYSVLIRYANKSLKEKFIIKTTSKLVEDVTVTRL